MEVKINIEAGQIGDTVIDLFKNIPSEKKEELALSILKEWLQSPEFFETKNKEQLLVDEFRNGSRKSHWSSTKYDENTPEHTIKSDYAFQEAIKTYKTSKQILVEDVKNEIISYYKKYITEQIANHELINQIKEETYKEIASRFPEIITQIMISVFSSNLSQLSYQIQDASRKSDVATSMTQTIMERLNLR